MATLANFIAEMEFSAAVLAYGVLGLTKRNPAQFLIPQEMCFCLARKTLFNRIPTTYDARQFHPRTYIYRVCITCMCRTYVAATT